MGDRIETDFWKFREMENLQVDMPDENGTTFYCDADSITVDFFFFQRNPLIRRHQSKDMRGMKRTANTWK